MTSGDPLLIAREVRRSIGSRTVLDGVDVELSAGEWLAILGPNGAGKSTLFRILLLLEPADAGQVLFAGRPVSVGDRSASQRMSGVFQRPHLFAGTVADNITFGLRARGWPPERIHARLREVVALLRLESLLDAPVQTLSGGEAQRTALARALAPNPDVLLLDEPTSNLDVTVRRELRDDLQRLVLEKDRAAMLITHDPAEAFALADRIAVLQEGRLVQCGRPDDLILNPNTAFVAAITGAELLLHGRVHELVDGLLTIRVGEGAEVHVALHTPGDGFPQDAAVHVAYRPEDVLLTDPDATEASSARNRYVLRIGALTPTGSLVRVRLEGPIPLVAMVTRAGAEALGLRVGDAVGAQLKATALRAFPLERGGLRVLSEPPRAGL